MSVSENWGRPPPNRCSQGVVRVSREAKGWICRKCALHTGMPGAAIRSFGANIGCARPLVSTVSGGFPRKPRVRSTALSQVREGIAMRSPQAAVSPRKWRPNGYPLTITETFTGPFSPTPIRVFARLRRIRSKCPRQRRVTEPFV